MLLNIFKKSISNEAGPKRPSLRALLTRVLPVGNRGALDDPLLEAEEMFRGSADSLGISETELLLRIGRANRVPVLFRLRPILALASLAAKPLEFWQKARAVPVKWSLGGGIACLDPETLSGSDFGSSAFFLTTPAEIRGALGEHLVESKENETKAVQVALALISRLREECEINGADRVEVIFGSGISRYRFFDRLGREGVGDISLVGVKALRRAAAAEGFRSAARCGMEASAEGFNISFGDPAFFKSPTGLVSTGEVLILDDDREFGESLVRVLERRRIPAEVFSDLEAIQVRMDESRIGGAVLIDLHMPTISGFEALKILGVKKVRSWTLGVLSSDKSVQAEIESLALGAVDFIGKDQNPKVIAARIIKMLEMGRGPL